MWALVPAIGFLFGFVGSMPVAGPVSILVLERALEGRFRGGLALAAGAAVAEAAYAFLAFFGLSALLARYPVIVPGAQACAAVIMLVLGVALLRRRPAAELTVAAAPGARSEALLGFTITALNPTFLATWTAAVTALYGTGLVRASTRLALPFSLGAAVGIVAWFAVLLALVHRYGGRLSQRTVHLALRAMGIGLLALGVWFAASFARFLARWGGGVG